MRTQSSWSSSSVIGTATLLVAALSLTACSGETKETPRTGQAAAVEATATPRAEARMTLAPEPAAPVEAPVDAPADEATLPAPEAAVAAVPPPPAAASTPVPVLTLQESVDVALKEAEPRLGELQTEAEDLGDLARINVKPQLERLEAQIKALNERRSDWGSQSEEAWKKAHMDLVTTLRLVEYEVYHSKLDAGLIPPPEVPGGVKDRTRGEQPGQGPAPRTPPRRGRAPVE